MNAPLSDSPQPLDACFLSESGEALSWPVSNASALPFTRLATWAHKGERNPRFEGNLILALKNGANPNARSSEKGQNLLSHACSHGSWRMASLLLAAGAAPVPFSTSSKNGERGVDFSDSDFTPRNHPLLASLAFLASSQDALLSRWAKDKAPASEAEKLRDPGFDEFLANWLKAGGELSPQKASSKALREIFSHPVFAAARAFLDQAPDASRWDAQGISPLACLARSRKLRPLGQSADRFLLERPALRECVAQLAIRLVRLSADPQALMSVERPASPSAPASTPRAAPESLQQMFRDGDRERIPGFDSHLRERIFSAIEAEELVYEMRLAAYGPLPFAPESDPSQPPRGAVRL